MIHCTLAESEAELLQILELQKRNLVSELSPSEMLNEGFLTVKHDLPVLREIAGPYKHIVAKDKDRVVGFALVMLREFRNAIPVLIPMFDLFDALEYRNKKLQSWNYLVLGQICVDKDYRGQGIFQGLYDRLREAMRSEFSLLVTEVATRNKRSMKAHRNVGFKSIKVYVSPEKEEWDIVAWDWS